MAENLIKNNNIKIKDIETCLKHNDFKQAEKLCHVLLEKEPENYEAMYFLGFIQLALNNFENSKKYFSDSVKLSAKSLGNWCLSIGNAYKNAGAFDNAIEFYLKAVKFLPERTSDFYNDIAIIYQNKGNNELAIEYYERAIKNKSDYYIAMSNLAYLLKEKKEFMRAETLCRRAISINSEFVQAYYYLALILINQNEPLNAIPFLEKAFEINPDYTPLYKAYAVCLLVTKNFKKGWKAYEERHRGLENNLKPKGDKPEWKGENLKGKKFYVVHEQGYGDTIQFVRYLPKLVKMGAKVIFKPQKELENLLIQSNLGIEISDKDLTDEFDCYSLLLSIPQYLKVTDKNIPNAKGYLKANPEKVAEYKEKYFNDTEKFKVGIFWQGNPKFGKDKRRSVSLENFYDLARIKNVQLYSLQKGLGKEQLKSVPNGIKIIPLGETFKDFSDTAAAVENLDLVITVDSAVAHLTGALGKPVWMLLSYIWEWRWFGADKKTPWYNSMKIFAQKEHDNWAEVFERVNKSLKQIFKNKTFE